MAIKTKSAAAPALLLEELALLNNQEAELAEKKRALAKKLREAAQALDGQEMVAGVFMVAKPPQKKPRRKKSKRARRLKPMVASDPIPSHKVRVRPKAPYSWPAVMGALIKEAQFGISNGELKVALAKTALGPLLERSDKPFYNTISRMIAAGFLVRHNGKLFTPHTLHLFLEAVLAGEVRDEPPPPPKGHSSPARDLILEHLQVLGHGVPVSNLFPVLEDRGGMDFEGKNSKTAIYNLVARLVERGVLSKDSHGNVRFVKKNEAPSVGAQGASH